MSGSVGSMTMWFSSDPDKSRRSLDYKLEALLRSSTETDRVGAASIVLTLVGSGDLRSPAS